MAFSPPATLYSLGGIVQWIDTSLNTMLLAGVAQNVQKVTEAIWLPLELAVAISLMLYGFLVSTQQIPTPFGQALVKIFKVVFIVGLLEAGGFYQVQIMDAMLALPDELMKVVTGNPTMARDVLADFHNSGLETATRLGDRAPSMLTEIGLSILFSVVSLIITLMYTLVTIFGVLMMSIAKVGMALIIMVGPIFIAAFLFEQTKKFFTQWLEQALYYSLYSALFTLMFALVMGMLGYIQGILLNMTEAPEINVLQILAAVVFISVLSFFLLKLPNVITGKLTGGAGVDLPFIGRI